MVYRIYVSKKPRFDSAKQKLLADLNGTLGVPCDDVTTYIRYDVEGIDEATLKGAIDGIFSEPPVDDVTDRLVTDAGDYVLIVEYLEGQYDQRADSAMQCVQLYTGGARPLVRCATVYRFRGVKAEDVDKIKKYLINPVDSKEGRADLPATLRRDYATAERMRVELNGLIGYDESQLKAFYDGVGFAMSFEDLKFVQSYFRSVDRDPTLTEIKVIDTYWSDHCRHTTFLTEIKSIEIVSPDPHIAETLALYRKTFESLYAGRTDKYPCLMDIATIAAKVLRKEGYLDNLDLSDEINACSVKVKVDVDGKDQDWLIMFKNETHNHPTEIEPFGGAATCLGGAIRDPLSGRTYVYQAMRITGAGDPTEGIDKTLAGKLPQRVLTKTALAGFSSYGNQIGLATGIVHEIYNNRYKAKRLETGYVIGGAPAANVVRKKPVAGNAVLLIGGDTGRDGCGGATGSSKSHTVSSVEQCGAEVQKGNAPEERKLQRLFRNAQAARMIVKCNDFGAGGVCVAIGELSDGIDIFLDRVNKKYAGLSATELAISESQERMAVVVERENVEAFKALAAEENLKVAEVGVITDSKRLRMYYGAETICDIEREFLDTNGVKQTTTARITGEGCDFFVKPAEDTARLIAAGKAGDALLKELAKLNNCSQKGAGETFDSTIGAGTVLMPFGGRRQLTPVDMMASYPPVNGITHTVTCSSYGICTELMEVSPYTGSIYSIVGAVSKLIAGGVRYDSIRLTLQEFFKRLNKDAARWGEPLQALLGAFDAQMNLKLAAIGGKDSMSGSFEQLDVPPTLIAFAMGIADDRRLVHNAFGPEGKIYHFAVPKDGYGYPDYRKLLAMYAELEGLIAAGKVRHTAVVGVGGRAVALVKSLLGNGAGAQLDAPLGTEDFLPLYGDILVVADGLKSAYGKEIGSLNDTGNLTTPSETVAGKDLLQAFTATLESVFPTTAPASGEAKAAEGTALGVLKCKAAIAKPRVLIPAFPGTNCEDDTARAFERAGAKAEIFVIRNQTPADIEASIAEIAKRLSDAQMIAFPGGFSGGDEPDGSGKFIATTFRNPRLKEAVEELLYARDGLALGICNGFQALIKLGLLPYGRIAAQTASSPTLTYNNISRHVSTISRVRVGTTKSPWLSACKVGEIYSVPVSHGEGKFVADDDALARLILNGQIATQYVDDRGNVTMESPYNPNGSVNAIEGIISTDGRVIGKMGHTERYRSGLYRNVEGNYAMPIFEGGVKYFG